MRKSATDKPYYTQTNAERVIDRIINNDKELTEPDLLKIYVAAQVEAGIEAFRKQAATMSLAELRSEEHNSSKLSENMGRMGDPRPHSLCDAHAIISGAHPKAAVARLILAKRGRRIDDPVNGCWLPRNTEAKKKMPRRLQNAVPHSRIHRHQYYNWLASRVTLATAKTADALDRVLASTACALQSGSHPPEVMLPAHIKHSAFK